MQIKTMHAGRNDTCYSSADSTVISGQALETELLFPFKGDPQLGSDLGWDSMCYSIVKVEEIAIYIQIKTLFCLMY